MANIHDNIQRHDGDYGSLADYLSGSGSSVVSFDDRDPPLQSSAFQGLSLSDQWLQPASCAEKYYRWLIRHTAAANAQGKLLLRHSLSSNELVGSMRPSELWYCWECGAENADWHIDCPLCGAPCNNWDTAV